MAQTTTCVKNLADGIMEIFDGSNPAQVVQVAVAEGDLSFSYDQRPAVVIMDRNELSALRKGKAKPCSGKFQFKFKEFLSQGRNPVTPHEAFFGKGAAQSWVSTGSAVSPDVRCIGIRFICVSPVGGEAPEVVTFALCHDIKEAFSEKADANILAIDFQDFEEQPTIQKGEQELTTVAGTTTEDVTDMPTAPLTTGA